MAKKINMPDFQAKLSRHSHDVSAGFTSSMSTGHIIPQYFDIAQPGDAYYFDSHMFVRMQDVVTAFLGEIQVHLDWFFVPLQMIYTPFGSVLFQTSDLLSSAYKTINSHDEALYGNFPLMDLRSSVNRNFVTTIENGETDVWGKSTARLLDSLDLNPLCVLNDYQFNSRTSVDPDIESVWENFVKPNSDTPIIAPWILCAYQAIYQKYYRNDDLERFDIASYNIDQFYNSTEPFVHPDLIRLRTVQRVQDYFTSVKVSPIASSINALQYQNGKDDGVQSFDGGVGGQSLTTLAEINNFLGNDTAELSDANNNQGFTYPMSRITQFASGNNDLTSSNLRTLFAVEKYMRIWGRAEKTYDDQVLAHFGYKVQHDIKHDLTHICHCRGVLQSDPVYSTSTSGNENGSVLGQVGGQGSLTFGHDREKFVAPVHGVIMCVAYAQTKPRYEYTFNKLHLLKNRLDFPLPEYDKLGMQPLYGFEFNPIFFSGSSSQGYDISKRQGWQFRYSQFKKKYNRVGLNFSSLSRSRFVQQSGQETQVNIFNPWVLSRYPFYDSNPQAASLDYLPVGSLFESPESLNNVMVVPYDIYWHDEYFSQPHLMFATDPLITEFMANVKKVSWMSETGEPDL